MGSVLLIFLWVFLCVVLLCVLTFRVSCCDVRYDFRIKKMFGSSLPPAVCGRAHVLFTFLFWCLLVCSGVRFILCYVFFSFFLHLVYPMLPCSFSDCPFWLPLRYSLTFICKIKGKSSSCSIAPKTSCHIYTRHLNMSSYFYTCT